MNHGYGIPAAGPGPGHPPPQPAAQEPARYLVVIESGGTKVARLFLASRVPVAEFDAGAGEVVAMTSALLPQHSAHHPEWDEALQGHSPQARREAEVYTLQT